jgi:hypothetical protein
LEAHANLEEKRGNKRNGRKNVRKTAQNCSPNIEAVEKTGGTSNDHALD